MALHLVAAAVAVALHLVAAAVVDTDYTVVVRIVTVPSILRQVGLGMHPEKHNWPDHLAFAVAVVLYKFFVQVSKVGEERTLGLLNFLYRSAFFRTPSHLRYHTPHHLNFSYHSSFPYALCCCYSASYLPYTLSWQRTLFLGNHIYRRSSALK